MSTNRLFFLIDGEWLCPTSPPPGWDNIEQVIAGREWYLTIPLAFQHSRHGEVFVSPASVPAKVLYGK